MSESGVHTHNAFALLDDEAPAKQSKPKEVKEVCRKLSNNFNLLFFFN